MKNRWLIGVATLAVAAADTVAEWSPGGPESVPMQLEDFLEAYAKPGGVAFVAGHDTDGVVRRLLSAGDWRVYAQVPEADNVAAARLRWAAQGELGRRVWIDHDRHGRFHLADNTADLAIIADSTAPIDVTRLLRVLRPEGRVWMAGQSWAKPLPDGTDDWSHPYHGPDNNPWSRDRVIRAPYLTQFLADPRYAPLPQLAVAAGGRVFKAFGHIAFKEREEPWLNTLAAFNAYNGALLWRRPIPEALMVHRNILIATADTVYFGDDQSCKVLDAATGELQRELRVPAEVAEGTFWKWMALEADTLYALIGGAEERDPVIRMRSDRHGWPWDPLSPGFNRPEHNWGYGPTLVALDPATGAVRWHYREAEEIDSRAVCMAGNRLYAFRFGRYLTALDARTGRVVWRQTPESAPDLFAALGDYQNRQDWRTNWRTTSYLKCSAEALYFAGPQVDKVLAVSADDGRVLWSHPYSNYQLVLAEEGVYGISGQIDETISRRFHPLTGEVLEEIEVARRACTRPTGHADALFFRASGGSVRLDLSAANPELVSPMRAQCQDGVTIAHGLLYWWPSVCDCNLTLYGITCLGPAGAFDFALADAEEARLEPGPGGRDPIAPFEITPRDWPTFRANNQGTAVSAASLPAKPGMTWTQTMGDNVRPTPPVAAGGRVFVGGSDGAVRAFAAQDGEPIWTTYTGGPIRIPPTLWRGRALVGSGDGWVYCLEAATGRVLWRFHAAPVERRIPVYGQLQSTWPAASGVLVEGETAYVAAGIVNYDGTYVYALDAATGAIRWTNTTSGHLDPVSRSGVSVQGHLLTVEGRLYLPGGNALSPAVYDLATGRCLNDAEQLQRRHNVYVPGTESPRGWELYTLEGQVRVSGKPYYAHPDYGVYDASVFLKTLVSPLTDRDVLWINGSLVQCYPRISQQRPRQLAAAWGKTKVPGLDALWQRDCPESRAAAVSQNAVVTAGTTDLLVMDLNDGQVRWRESLTSPVVPWGLAIDAEGCVLITLENGRVRGWPAPRQIARR